MQRIVTATPCRAARIVAAVAILAAVACRPDEGVDAGGSVRDSAGVRIVTSGATGQWAEGAGWHLVEDRRIGEVEGPPEYTFNFVSAVAVAPGDTVFVLDEGDRIIKVYDPQGRFVRQFGGDGEGPGEFRAPSDLIVAGNEVIACDGRLRRLTFFGRDGHLIRTATLDPDLGWVSSPRLIDDTTLILATQGSYSPTPSASDGRFWLVHVTPNGAVIDTLLTAASSDVAVSRAAHSVSVITTPFGRAPHFDVAPDGRVAFGRGEQYAINVYRYTPDARLVSSIRRSVPLLPATEEDRAAYRRGFAHSRMPEPFRKRNAELLETVTYPSTWPAYSDLRFDAANRLWVEESVHGADSLVPWAVFAPDGSYLGTVTVPRRLQMRAIEDDALWAVEPDDLGVQSVVRYRIEKTL